MRAASRLSGLACSRHPGLIVTAACLVGLLAFLPEASAQRSGFPGFSGSLHGGATQNDDMEPSYNDGRPAALATVGIDQRLDNQVPLDLQFTDETGASVTIGDYLQSGKPLILSLAYYGCPMLCTQVLNGLASGLKGIGLVPGTDFDMITVSFDSTEGSALAAEKRANYIDLVDRPGIETTWHFLTGKSAPIATLTDAVGFRYEWDDETKQFAHASAIMVLTPEGRVSRYLFGMEFAPRDIKLALVEASDNKIGTVIDQVLLFCYHYDPATGQYGAAVMNLLRLAAVMTMLGLAGLLFILLRHGRNHPVSDLAPRPVGGR